MPAPEPLQQVDRTCVRWRGRKLAYFAGCDYFRLASHPRVLEAVEAGLHQFGLNVAASRLTTGQHELYADLETRLAKWFGARAALLAASGYATNIIAAQALAGDFTHVLIDSKAHVSLRDASRFLDAPVLEFAHGDARALAARLQRLRGAVKPLLLCDGVFAQNGEVAPLREYLEALPPSGMILLDDAHSAGVLGASGQGTLEYAGVPRRRIVQTMTLSKAFGVYGGAILCEPALRRKMIARSWMFGGATPLPLPLAFAAKTSLQLLRQDVSLRCRLSHNVGHVKRELRARGLDIPETPSPVIALPALPPVVTKKLRQALLDADIYPSFIRYPGGSASGNFRFVISSEHNNEQLTSLLDTIKFLR